MAVVFDAGAWLARYPEFSGVSNTLAQLYFNEACLYCDNTATSPITDDSVGGARETVLNMLTAHIAALAGASLVGRIASATEGSVTVQVQNDYPPGSAQWFQQTKYGAAFWMATAQYRTMRYVRGCSRW